MADCCDLVYKDHNISFKDLSCISEVSNIAKPEYSHNLLSRNHDIDDAWVLNYSADNLSSGLAESYSKQRAYFNDGILKNDWLSLFNLLVFFCYFLKTKLFQLDFFDSI
jgi:hypothetical protein